MSKIIDLSMEVIDSMITFYGVPKPVIKMLDTYEEYATNVGVAAFCISDNLPKKVSPQNN